MSAQILSFPTAHARPQDEAIITAHYFGGCPHCGDTDGHLDDAPDHWFICHRHKIKWCAGSNLFSGWRNENEETWLRNRSQLSAYMTVEPVMPLRED